MSTVKKQKKDFSRKKAAKKKASITKGTKGSFEKAWEFWKEAQIDMSKFKFEREVANAR